MIMKTENIFKQFLLYFIVAMFLMAIGCSGGGGGGDDADTPAPASSVKAITSFAIVNPADAGTVGPGFWGTITESTHSIAVTVPSGTDVTALTVGVLYTGASISPAGCVQDFTNPVTYTVTAADGSTQDYTVTVTVATEDSLTQKADFGGVSRFAAVGFSIESKGYIGTGKVDVSLNEMTKDFWAYDPATNTWTQKADFGGIARNSAFGFSIGSKGYIGTGYIGQNSPTCIEDFWEYDPATNTWTQKADFGGGDRCSAVGFSIGSKGYIGTGGNGSDQKDFWEYDPATDKWTQKADFGGIVRTDAVGFSIGTKGYIGTGWSNDANGLKDFWEYDPATDKWTQKADFGGTARDSAVGFSIGTKGYIGTGWSDDGAAKDFWEYDPATDKWTRKADFGGTARDNAVGFSIGSKGYIGTGDDSNDIYTVTLRKDFWEYIP